ncbi:MAG: hypothetical protein M5U01_36585 [Ardenticatenaceae bacterium]|nr:hypothetical protein [Ardenticatenaceae bacterium]
MADTNDVLVAQLIQCQHLPEVDVRLRRDTRIRVARPCPVDDDLACAARRGVVLGVRLGDGLGVAVGGMGVADGAGVAVAGDSVGRAVVAVIEGAITIGAAVAEDSGAGGRDWLQATRATATTRMGMSDGRERRTIVIGASSFPESALAADGAIIGPRLMARPSDSWNVNGET